MKLILIALLIIPSLGFAFTSIDTYQCAGSLELDVKSSLMPTGELFKWVEASDGDVLNAKECSSRNDFQCFESDTKSFTVFEDEGVYSFYGLDGLKRVSLCRLKNSIR